MGICGVFRDRSQTFHGIFLINERFLRIFRGNLVESSRLRVFLWVFLFILSVRANPPPNHDRLGHVGGREGGGVAGHDVTPVRLKEEEDA